MPEIGQTISHYRILEKIGQGGMGEVYLADDMTLDRKVALKFLPEAFTSDPERMARFEREAKLLASLNHPNIAGIHGLEQAAGKRFLVLEYVKGETLQARLSKGALALEDALALCRQIAEGLEAAHEKGVIHRDLKPANVMITAEEKLKILDFGLAKALSDETQSIDSSQSPTLTEAMTQPGVILGTAAYMSPEQAKGKSVDKRADIWSLGCILFECMTGKRAFEGETVTETLAAILRAEPEWQALPGNTPPSIRVLLRHCLRRDLKHRFRDAADARIEIDEALAFLEKPDTTVPAARKSNSAALLILTSVALLVLGGIVSWIIKPSLSPSSQPPVYLEADLPLGDRLPTIPSVVLSPDGHYLVYVAIHGGIRQLIVRQLNSREGKPLQGTEGASCPFFSPDGQWIGFFARGKLKKISIAGGPTRSLCNAGAPGGATWGTDGTIVYAPSNTSGLLRISENGGEPQIVTRIDRTKGETSHRWPQLLPGGKALLFTIVTGFGWDEFHTAVMKLDTKEIRIILRGSNTCRFVPTGHLVYYRAGSLMAVPFDPISLEVSSRAPETIMEGIAQSTGLVGGEFCFSNAGSLAYVPASLRQFERRLVWVDRKGEVEPLTAPVRAYNAQTFSGLGFSPNGRRIAIQIVSGTREIWIYDLDRGALIRLVTDGSSIYPIWTPDGKRISYTGFRAGLRNIYWKNADSTGEEERLTIGENQQVATSWSPDGNWLAFQDTSPDTGNDIWVLQIDGEHEQEPFVRTQFNEGAGQFSPDGRWLAYQSNESGRMEIYLQPFPGPGGKWQVSSQGGEAPLWARNGRELFYRSGNKIMSVDIKTDPTLAVGKSRLLFQGKFGPWDVAPDGQRFLMIQPVEPEQPAIQINLVLNWFEELRERVPVD